MNFSLLLAAPCADGSRFIKDNKMPGDGDGNDHYKYDDKLPEYDEVKATLKTANEALIKDAECVNDESVAREIQIRKDDARHIRTTGVG